MRLSLYLKSKGLDGNNSLLARFGLFIESFARRKETVRICRKVGENEIPILLAFDSVSERKSAVDFMQRGGRDPGRYLAGLVRKDMYPSSANVPAFPEATQIDLDTFRILRDRIETK